MRPLPRLETSSFNSPMANLIFGTAPDPTREVMEAEAVERFRQMIELLSSREIFRLGPFIDAVLIPKLSGRNQLAVMKMIESRSPATIESMPTVRKAREHLRRASEVAQILAPAVLERVIAGVMAEAAGGGGKAAGAS